MDWGRKLYAYQRLWLAETVHKISIFDTPQLSPDSFSKVRQSLNLMSN